MNLDQMINEIDQNKKQISEDIEMFRFLKEETEAKVIIHIRASIPTDRADDGSILHVESRSCNIETINQKEDEDIEALKRIICRNVTNLKNENADLANMMISILREDADQGSEEQ